MNVKQAVPFFMVGDMDASLRFYVDGLGFTKTIDWTPRGRVEWCRLELDEVAVMLQEYRKDLPDHPVPSGPRGVGVSICFTCVDAIRFFEEATARGLAPRRPFVGNGMWVTSLTDPDGYRLAFQSPTDAAEGTEYA
jgi:lactoylglutathione lyase